MRDADAGAPSAGLVRQGWVWVEFGGPFEWVVDCEQGSGRRFGRDLGRLPAWEKGKESGWCRKSFGGRVVWYGAVRFEVLRVRGGLR